MGNKKERGFMTLNYVTEMRELLAQMIKDLDKAAKGNKTAAQRVRTGSVLLAKVAKEFRRESIALEKKGRK